jgi:hypothetical protein
MTIAEEILKDDEWDWDEFNKKHLLNFGQRVEKASYEKGQKDARKKVVEEAQKIVSNFWNTRIWTAISDIEINKELKELRE